MDNVVIVYQAASIMERDALVAELAQHGILAVGEVRDMSRKMTNTTVDLTLGGYSSVTSGFPISTSAADAREARKIIYAFLARVNGPKLKSTSSSEDSSNNPAKMILGSGEYSSTGPYMRKFYASAMYTIMFPGVFHILGAGHLSKAILTGERINKTYFMFALLVYILTGVLGFYFLASLMGK